MKWSKWLAVFGVMMAVAGQAQARSSVPIVDYEDQMIVRADGKKLTEEEVRKAIIRAGTKRKWSLSNPGGNNVIRALYHIRSHDALVDITYTAERFSVKYHDSENLNYAKVDTPQLVHGQIINPGQRIIHPYYNDWVRQLVEEIQQALQE